MKTQPMWLLSLLGQDMSWQFLQTVWFWMTVVFKLCLWLLAVLTVWLTLWAKGLRTD